MKIQISRAWLFLATEEWPLSAASVFEIETGVAATGSVLVDATGYVLVDATGFVLVNATGSILVDATGSVLVDTTESVLVDAFGVVV